MDSSMKHVGDYYIKEGKIYIVTRLDFERKFTRCNEGTTIATNVSYKIETPIIEEIDLIKVKSLLKENEEWLRHLMAERKYCSCIYEYESNNERQWKANYAILKLTKLIKELGN